MLNLIIGSSGSGKTESILASIRRDVQEKKRCFLIVPEQQAYITERDLPEKLPSDAGLYLEIVNFSGLCEDLFREYGGIASRRVSSGASAVLMWDTLRTLSPVLCQYGKTAGSDPALTAEMLSAAEELTNSGIDSDALEEAAAKLPAETPLRKKLSDLAMILALHTEKKRAVFGVEQADRLHVAAELLEKHNYFSDCRIYLDSFTSFTAPEYEFLSALLPQADHVTVSLCADRYGSELLHFECVCETARRLNGIARKVGTEVHLLSPAGKASSKPEALRILERELWNFRLTREQRAVPPSTEPLPIRAVVCPNVYEEAEACAINILGLIQGGMRYGDVAVIVRDADSYRGILDAAMERHKIPYFFSERTALSSKPLARLILSALRSVTGYYRQQDVMTLVKTGLCDGDLRDVSLFEDYCTTWRISGKRFLDDAWSMNPDGLTERRSDRGTEILAAANRVRSAVITPLIHLHTALRASDRLPDRCRAIYGYLEELKASETLSALAAKQLSLGQKREAGETVRLYRFVIETLTDLCTLLPDAVVTVNEFLTILTLYFSLADLGSVPAEQDCVMIGTADTLRVENVKASFLLGLCEGEFPRAVTDKGLLSETEKATLESLGLQLDSRQKLRSSEELFYVYRAMTKPTERLFLSYPAKQPDGSERTPSLGFTRIGFLFDLESEVFHSADLLRKEAENAEKIKNHHRARPAERGAELHLSQSSIQAFVSCPYRYYSTYQLNVRSQKSSDINASDEGNFLHFVFEQFLKSSLNENNQLILPKDEALASVADEIIAVYIEKVCPIPEDMMDARLLHLFARLRVLALAILKDITSEIRCGSFVPTYFEQRLGGRGENALPPVRFGLTDGGYAEVHGTVDRVDLLNENGKLYVRIVDYKTGEHKFSFQKVRSGEDLQLVLYLFAVVAADPDRFVPCGAEFLYSKVEKEVLKIARSGFLLEGDEISTAADGSEGGVYSKGLSRQSAEELSSLMEEMQKTVCSVAERILAGEANKTPSKDACRFCPVIDHCDVACREKN